MTTDEKGPGLDKERGPARTSPPLTIPHQDTVFTRSADLPAQLDSHAAEAVAEMVAKGWQPSAAADSWLDYVVLVAESAADLAVAEIVWAAS